MFCEILKMYLKEKLCQYFPISKQKNVNKNLISRTHSVVAVEKKLRKSFAVDESGSTSGEDEESSETSAGWSTETSTAEAVSAPTVPKQTEWEKLQDLYLQNRLKFVNNASQESVLEEEDEFVLAKMYQEKSTEKAPPEPVKNPSQETLNVIDELIKSFEREAMDSVDKALTINLE